MSGSQGRHPSVEHLMQFLHHDLYETDVVVQSIGECASEMDHHLKDCPEKTAGLRKLLEAKDCFLRAGVK